MQNFLEREHDCSQSEEMAMFNVFGRYHLQYGTLLSRR